MAKHWKPEPRWKDQACYIIGGGPSLKEFDFKILRDKNVIGCNAALYIGPEIVPTTVFGDAKFYQKHRYAIKEYLLNGGELITTSPQINRFKAPSEIKVAEKKIKGLSNHGRLGWNSNTGSIAINLALMFGASQIYLLGYDMQIIDGQTNYHNAYDNKINPKAYTRFLRGMTELARDLQLFPGQSVINLEDNTSALGCFPKESLKEHFAKELVS
jgi:hypothetical protein